MSVLCRQQLLIGCVVLQLLCLVSSDTQSDVIQTGNEIIEDFYHRYNTTEEIDLVFVLDRSGSVPRSGWASMINFVRDILEHFTVDKDNTRVAIVTYSTTSTVDINDLEPGTYSDGENKCTLNRRIEDYVQRKIPYGFTATYDALNNTYDILLNSRPNAKKAVFVLTDGKSNIGPPPVKVAFDLLSLQWDESWNVTALGPQVEIYAFGIDEAQMTELESIGSKLPNHVFLIPNFRLFEDLARSLHGDQQEEGWIPAQKAFCGDYCLGLHAHCMCGTKIGQYACVCSPGFYMKGITCSPCPKGYYKTTSSPDSCTACPTNTTTQTEGSTHLSQCKLLPGLTQCTLLPDIEHAQKFRVAGTGKNEVMNTGVSCDDVTDGNSCHYECQRGYRLTGSPVMICNASGLWEGIIPNCTIVDCHKEGMILEVPDAEVHYINASTTYGSHLQVSCNPGLVPFGATYWMCNKHGHWTQPTNFQCVALFCKPLYPQSFLTYDPPSCASTTNPVDQSCTLSCPQGFQMEGPGQRTCIFDEEPTWLPDLETRCVDVEPPTIICPDTLTVQVPGWGNQFTYIYYDTQKPLVTDNSWQFNYSVEGAPEGYKFPIGWHTLTYQAMDAAGNTASCTRNIHVEAKQVVLESCPSDITAVIDRSDRTSVVTWDEPVFTGSGNSRVDYKCSRSNGLALQKGEYHISCHDLESHSASCNFIITVNDPECNPPFQDRLPVNGLLGCTNASANFPKTCRVHCEIGFELRTHRAEHTFQCLWDGQWDIQEPWPSCYPAYRRKDAIMKNGIYVRYEGDCEADRDNIKTGFKYAIETLFAQHSGCVGQYFSCSVDDIELYCGSGRVRRSSLQQYLRPVRDVEEDQDITIRFSIKETINKTERQVTEKDQQELLNEMDHLYSVISGLFEDLKLNVSSKLHNVTEFFDVTEAGEFVGNCSAGQLRQFRQTSARCLSCPAGAYFVNDDCLPCALGFYQDEDEQFDCKPCPAGTNTTLPGANQTSDCKDPCQPGFYSSNGYSPCQPCPVGTFQNATMSDQCVTCPDNTTTAEKGVTDIEGCTSYCTTGSYSASGLEPCTRCQLHSFQPELGGTNCLPCPVDESHEYCPVFVECASNVTCVHGECVMYEDDVMCQCTPGYSGDTCDEDVDECLEVECLNNATCRQGIDSYQCLCQSGFTGVLCELEVNECDSSPCLNTGYCQDQVDSYYCYCPSGFTGINCELNIDDCVNQTCEHGNCKDLIDDYECVCEPGYGGRYCELLVDYCADVVCENGGQCENVGDTFICQCKAGFVGTYCDEEENDCDSDPCHNNGTCIDKQQGFLCKCPPGFTGDLCQKEVSSNFDLVFPDSHDASYVRLTEVTDLSAFTVCLWMRTMDTGHYGTLLSYAADSNWLSADNTNVLTLHDYGRLQLVVNGASVSTNISLNDGWWQHLCVTWQSLDGEWAVLLNGTHVTGGIGLARGTYLQGGGVLVLGQEQDSVGGGFNTRDSFIGEMSQLNMYDYVLSQEQIVGSLADKNMTCKPGRGNVVTWTDVIDGVKGRVSIRSVSYCLDYNQCYPGVFECLADFHCVLEDEVYQCQECTPGQEACGGVNTCAAQPCLNGADCIDGSDVGDFSCVCVEGFTGNLCEISLEGCISDLCQNGGTCLQEGATIRCLCPLGYAGHYCDTEYTGGCASHPCLHGATCVPDGDFYNCECPRGYEGARCEHVMDMCLYRPCQHNGTCVSGGDQPGFSCECRPPYKGKYCHITHRPSCDQTPCLNGGTCSMDEGSAHGYQCLCPTSVTTKYGPNCEIQTACDSAPCLNGATCAVRSTDLYTCLCTDAYEGVNCDIAKPTTEAPSTSTMTSTTDDHDYCAGIHCENGGECLGKVTDSLCTCTIDYTGDYCEITRKQETRLYYATVTLLMKYTKTLKYNNLFKQRFREQVIIVYAPATVDSKLRVNLVDVKPGSTVVSFNMSHVVYADSTEPIYDTRHMRSRLVGSLKQGTLGNLKATMDDNFQFNKVHPDTKEVTNVSSPATWVYVVIILAVILVVALVFITVYLCRRRRSRPAQKQNNIPHTYHNQVNNPTFDSSWDAPQLKNIREESIYAEPGDLPKPHASTSSTNEMGERFPSKRGKDINKEWALRQRIPLPLTPAEEKTMAVARMSKSMSHDMQKESVAPSENEYLAPCKGTPPPSYKDLMGPCSRASSLASIPEAMAPEPPETKPSNLDAAAAAAASATADDDLYFTPISDEQAKLVSAGGTSAHGSNTPGTLNHGYRSRSNSGSVTSLIPEDTESLELAPGQYLPMTGSAEGKASDTQDTSIYVPPTPSSENGEPEYAIRGPLTSIS